MVRAAQQTGGLTSLYPEGVDRISQIPWYLQVAIEQGLTVLNWMENLPKKEVPPRHIWGDPEGLELWWKKLEELRANGSGAMPSSGSSDDEDAGTDNDLARAFKQG